MRSVLVRLLARERGLFAGALVVAIAAIFLGVPVDFVLFALTLAGVALFHHHTLYVALIGLGTMFEMAERTKILLEAKGLSVALLNPRFIKPLDANVLPTYARKCTVLCT